MSLVTEKKQEAFHEKWDEEMQKLRDKGVDEKELQENFIRQFAKPKPKPIVDEADEDPDL